MLQQFILPGEEVYDELVPYVPTLENMGIDAERIVKYAIKIIHNEDYNSVKMAITEDLECWQNNNQFPSKDSFEKMVYACMDAVGDALVILSPQIEQLLGRIPPSLTFRGFAGRDPVVGIVTEDVP